MIIHNENLFFLTPSLQIPYVQIHFYNSVVFILRTTSSINLITMWDRHISIKLRTYFTPKYFRLSSFLNQKGIFLTIKTMTKFIRFSFLPTC
ncbi:hypothetical protein C6351_30945 [Bacillus thuringiensis]|nr:hypothetical protein C6351_30945 [Bacillus thuringiensis]